MSMSFTRINSVQCENEPTFSLSSEVYEALLGDNNMPMGAEGAIPNAVEVPLGKLFVVLREALLLTGEDIAAYEATMGSDAEFWVQDTAAHIVAAATEITDDPEQGKRLLADYRHAIKHRWGGVSYSTEGISYG